jgi:hydrogenase large subunit
MAWDPITRIIGNLGIYTKIDFAERKVVECKSTSSMFRGYSVFMRGKDPRDAHFITSRICGICGDNHATCSVYAQNMAYGIKTPILGEMIFNLGEAAEYMFDHAIFQDNLVFVDFCERMVEGDRTRAARARREDRVAARRRSTATGRSRTSCGRSTRSRGAIYREALQMSRLTREMFCLMEGRHVHPSTLYPGGVGTVPTPQLFTDYLVRLIKFIDFAKKLVPLNDDIFDFFYEALPGYEKVGNRRILLGCWGAFQNPEVVDYSYERMTDWGRAMYVTPGVVVDGELVTTDLVEINLGIRILLGNSYYEDWQSEETFVSHDPLGNPVDKAPPLEPDDHPEAAEAEPAGRARTAGSMSPRWYNKRTGDFLPLDTAAGRSRVCGRRRWPGLVDTPYVKSTGKSVTITLPDTASSGEMQLEWKVPKWANTIERDRARAYFIAYAAAMAMKFVEDAMAAPARRRRPRASRTSTSPRRRSAAASTRRCAACCRTTW